MHTLANKLSIVVGLLLVGLIGPETGWALDPATKPVDYIATRWDAESGLPHNAVRHLYQTRDGYIWIGTGFGLARFDGMKFTVFTRNNTPDLVGNTVTGLAETPDGNLWIGTSSSLVRFRDGKFTSYTQKDGLKSEAVTGLCCAPDGSLWIGGREGISHWVGGKFINDLDTSKYDLGRLRGIIADGQKVMWVAASGIILRYKDGAFTSFGTAEGLSGEFILTLGLDTTGRLIAATPSSVMRFEGERFVRFEQPSELHHPGINKLITDKMGNLWVGSITGLERCSAGKIVPYTDRGGHKLGVVDTVLEDREGCIWVGGSDGLIRLTDRRAATMAQDEGISSNLVGSVFRTKNGGFWVSSWGGGVDRFENGIRAQHYELGAPLSHNIITLIYEAPDGSMWLGNRGSSIDHLEGEKVTTFVLPSGVSSSRPVRSAIVDDDGTLLLGIADRALLQIREGQIIPVPEFGEGEKRTVYCLFRESEGKLLAGTNQALYERQTDRSWRMIPFPGLPTPFIVRDIYPRREGGYWLATEGSGLVWWDHGRSRAYGSHQGIIDDILFSVLEDDLGAIWVSSVHGIARIRKVDLAAIDAGRGAKVNEITFGRADGLTSASAPGVGSPSVCRMPDGRLMFATHHGVAVIDPRTVQTNSQPPPVVIENVVADDRSFPATTALSLAPGTGKIEIHYTALSLVVPDRLQFRYKLDGSDPRWVEAGHERVAHYTHLSPGRYVFHVLACNNDGVWNETGSSLAVTLLPHYYQTVWFRLAIGSVLAAVLGGLVWVRVRRFNERQRELSQANAALDQRVKERTSDLSKSNEELRQRELLFRLIFEHAPVGISWKRTDLGDHYHFNPTFRRILDLPMDTAPDYNFLVGLIHPDDAPRQAEMNLQISSGKSDSYILEERFKLPDGRVIWGLLAVAVVRDEAGRITQDISILEDITARKEAERELVTTYQSLVDASRLAGMAEVATGVLHNVGNVLNSVNVSSSLIGSGLRELKVEAFSKVMAMFREHAGDLDKFLVHDPKGKRLPEFLESLASNFLEQRNQLSRETELMQKNIDHIKEIVAMHQAYAVPLGSLERLNLAALVEDAVRLNSEMLLSQDVRLDRDFQPEMWVLAEKGKVLQIITHLLTNAKRACDDAHRSSDTRKVITLELRSGDPGMVRLLVKDNGVGISPENLVRIFNHGFTTRKDGHGFGLHASANAAREMKGSLSGHSAGKGQGAMFILELCAAPAPVRAEKATVVNAGPVV